MRRTAFVIAPLAAAGLLFTGCSPDKEAEQKTENANAAVCANIKALQDTYSIIEGQAATAAANGEEVTVEQAQNAVNELDTAWNDVENSVDKLNSAAANQYAQALAEYQESLEGIDGDTSLKEAGKQVQEAQNNYEEAMADLVNTVGCD